MYDSVGAYLPAENRITFDEIAEEVSAQMESRYPGHVKIVPYNPTDSAVPHLVVLLENPPVLVGDPNNSEYSGLPQKRFEELKAINMVLRDPEFRYGRKKEDSIAQFDFEPTYEGVLYWFDLPLPILEKQKGVYIKNPKARDLQVPLEYFRDKTALNEIVEKQKRKELSFEEIKKSLDARQPFVYVPKEESPKEAVIYTSDMADSGLPRKSIRYRSGKGFRPIPLGSTLFPDGTVILPKGRKIEAEDVRIERPKMRQTRITKPETPKYWMKAREEHFRILRNDLIYHLPSADGIMIAELKPWGSIRDDEINGRYWQCRSYHNMLCYFGDERNVPIALTMPTLASPREHAALEVLHSETDRTLLVLTVAHRGYFMDMVERRIRRCDSMLELAEGMNLKNTKQVFGKRVKNMTEALRLVDEKKDERDWYKMAHSKFFR